MTCEEKSIEREKKRGKERKIPERCTNNESDLKKARKKKRFRENERNTKRIMERHLEIKQKISHLYLLLILQFS